MSQSRINNAGYFRGHQYLGYERADWVMLCRSAIPPQWYGGEYTDAEVAQCNSLTRADPKWAAQHWKRKAHAEMAADRRTYWPA